MAVSYLIIETAREFVRIGAVNFLIHAYGLPACIIVGFVTGTCISI